MEKEKVRIEKERVEFKKLLLQNQNYFGTFPSANLEAVKPIKHNTKYEAITCLGFDHEDDLLEATIDIKLPYGYGGSLCSTGSQEFIRFYVDWNGDGFFNDPGDDVGIASVNVHDIPNTPANCLEEHKPLSYTLRLQIDPKRNPCTKNNLVKVRAILSWELPPTPNDPNFIPPWGNVVDKWVQIKPNAHKVVDLLEVADLKKLGLTPSLLDVDLPISKNPALSLAELKELYQEVDVPEHRFNFQALAPIIDQVKFDPGFLATCKLNPAYADLLKNLDIIFKEETSKQYEEVHCLGLNYDLDQLVATFTIKKPYGYKGGLCTKGSKEYIGFWIYVYDQIEQQCLWRYLGQTSVNVHDIRNIPDDGLQYSAHLPVDFSWYKEKCHRPVVLKARAILSWDQPPPPNNPHYNPVWGNRIDALIQLKPKRAEGFRIPYIWAAGNMAVESITGNPDSIVFTPLGSGYAKGVSIGGGFIARDSPFGGVISISGNISNAPNNPSEAAKLRYKVQYRRLNPAGGWHDVDTGFRIWLRINGLPAGFIDQVATGGYFKYQKDLITPTIVEVQNDIMAIWRTKDLDDGLYEIRILLLKPGEPAMGDVPANHIESNRVKIRLDNKEPEASISLDTGPCTKFKVGDKITGKYTATDEHLWTYRLRIRPTVATPPTVSPTSETYPLLPVIPVPPPNMDLLGRIDAPFEVTTTSSTTPCGYVVELDVWDRTIRNNHMSGNHNSADVGLCLLEE